MARTRSKSKSKSKSKPKPKPIKGRMPTVGEVLRVPVGKGLFGLVWVLKLSGKRDLLLAGLDWIGRDWPSDSVIAEAKVLIRNHHSWRDEPETLNVRGPLPLSWKPCKTLRPPDPTIMANAFGYPEGMPLQMLMQWRWDHEHEQVLAEEQAARDAAERKRDRARAAELRRRAKMSLAKLRKEPILARDRQPYWAEDFPKARTIVRDTLDKLIALGTRASAEKKRDVFERCINRLLKLEQHSQLITKLGAWFFRDALEELARAAKMPVTKELTAALGSP
jgi:hypothetical protein